MRIPAAAMQQHQQQRPRVHERDARAGDCVVDAAMPARRARAHTHAHAIQGRQRIAAAIVRDGGARRAGRQAGS